ncbi:MAG: hypothetical protein V1661_02430 [bacterium]
MFNLRKILIIVGFAIIAVGLGFGIYFTFFAAPKETVPPPVTEAPAGAAGQLPSSGAAGLKPPGQTGAPGEITAGGLPAAKTLSAADLALSGATNITIAANGRDLQYYDSNSGLFYRTDANGALTPLSNKKFFEVKKVSWSGDNKKAVLEYPDGSNIVYDFSTDSQVTLPKHWQDFNFSPDGGKLVSKSIGADANNQWLIVSDTNGTNAKIVAALGDNADKVQVAWSPSNQVVGFSATGDATSEFGTQEIYLIGQNKENFKSLKVQGLNFKAAWAKEGDRLMYSVADPKNGYRPTLWATDASGDNVGSNTVKINLNTPIDKCAIVSGYKAYCAVPKDLPEGSGLDMNIAGNTQDSFYFVNLKTGATNLIGEPGASYDVSQISVSSDEKYIYFTDAANSGLHQIRIE